MNRVLLKEEEIKERWNSYFDKVFNGSHIRNWSKLSISIEDRNRKFVWAEKDVVEKDKNDNILSWVWWNLYWSFEVFWWCGRRTVYKLFQ